MAAPMENSTGDQTSRCEQISNACFRVIPFTGSMSLLGFSTHVMGPKLFQRAFHGHDMTVANCLWLNAHVGVGLYIYNTRHIRRAAVYQKILYSAYGTVVFNFGTLLIWVTSKKVLPNCGFVRSIFGVLSGLTMIIIGRDYLKFVDRATERQELEIAEE